jgi:hypothetical protein
MAKSDNGKGMGTRGQKGVNRKVTGTKDTDYDLLWYTEACLSNALRLETYITDAQRARDSQLAEFFRKAQADSRKGAEMGKDLLGRRLTHSMS